MPNKPIGSRDHAGNRAWGGAWGCGLPCCHERIPLTLDWTDGHIPIEFPATGCRLSGEIIKIWRESLARLCRHDFPVPLNCAEQSLIHINLGIEVKDPGRLFDIGNPQFDIHVILIVIGNF